MKFYTSVICATFLLVASPLWPDDDNDGNGRFGAKLSGSKEVPVNLSAGTGNISVQVSESPASASITLKYSGLSGNPTMAHLHLGNPWENGPVIVTICGGASGRPCAAQNLETAFTFPLTAGAITAIPAQGFTADVPTLMRALRAGVVYANVHTAQYPNGEVRGQVGRGSGNAQGAPGRGTDGNDGNGGKGKGKDRDN